MKSVKFSSPDSGQHPFGDAVRKNVSDYFKEKGISTKGNISLVMQTIIMFAAYIIPFVLIMVMPMNIWIAILMAILMGIHKGLRYLFRDPARGYAWIREPNDSFGGASALSILLRGEMTDLLDLRGWLDAERGAW